MALDLQATKDVEDIVLLDAEQCRQAAAAVRALEAHWTQRNFITPFYTLGAASYLDARGGQPRYGALAATANPVLRQHFSWLYEALTTGLAASLGAEVALDEVHALPGFHIFLAHPMFQKRTGELHCDLQYKHLDWSGMGTVDFGLPLSFTLALELPEAGGGLNVWDFEYAESVGLSKDQIRQEFARREQRFHPYEVGRCALHSGHLVHQIAPMPEADAGEARITLQGHALRCDGVWRLYW